MHQTNQAPQHTNGAGETTTGYYGEGQFGPRLVYTESHWRDPIFAVLWIVHMLGMAYALYGVWGSDDIETGQANHAFLVIFVVSVAGAVFGIIWMQVLRQCAGAIIKTMLFIYCMFMQLIDYP